MDTTYNDVSTIEPLDEVQRVYAVKDAGVVLAFLRAYPDLVPLLLETAAQLQRYFADAQLSLEWTRDPEELREQLFVGVKTELALDEAMDQLRQFDRGWWLDRLPSARGRLLIDLEP